MIVAFCPAENIINLCCFLSFLFFLVLVALAGDALQHIDRNHQDIPSVFTASTSVFSQPYLHSPGLRFDDAQAAAAQNAIPSVCAPSSAMAQMSTSFIGNAPIVEHTHPTCYTMLDYAAEPLPHLADSLAAEQMTTAGDNNDDGQYRRWEAVQDYDENAGQLDDESILDFWASLGPEFSSASEQGTHPKESNN